MRTLVWFRGKDLRLSDHAPLRDAALAGEVIPVFVLDPYFFAAERARGWPHRMQFLLSSLRALERNLADRGSRLLVVAGKSIEVIPRLAEQWKVDRVAAHRWVEPFGRERDRRVALAMKPELLLYEGETLLPPGTLRTQAGQPYSVFSQFARALNRAVSFGAPLSAPRELPPVPPDVRTAVLEIPACDDLGIEPNPTLLEGGERAARQRLRRFLHCAIGDYAADRDRMDHAGTSRLSADLKFGTLSVRQVWAAVAGEHGRTKGGRAFLNELVWREFAYSTLWDRPTLLSGPFRADFAGFPWRDDEAQWQAWTAGTTGYPIVDASARQLLGEGFVHNRARMISASFLTKHLLLDYRKGEAHYMRWLTDGDWANNNLGWQWSAGCGCDAQPYFRVFNPVTQGEKFDPEGDYVRRWVPELARMPSRFIHRPWEAPESVAREAGVTIGEEYPAPIVEHRFARERFLQTASVHLKRPPA